MPIPKSFLLLFSLTLWIANVGSIEADECASFDIPATIEGCDISDREFLTQYPHQRLIQMVVPCSVRNQCNASEAFSELAIEIQGLFPGFEVVDYAPNTRMITDIDGVVAVETKSETNHGLTFDLRSQLSSVASANAAAKTGSHQGVVQRYAQIPEQQLLLSSGTIRRGSGVFYQFRKSRQTTLEGEHELVLTVRLPDTWRGGLIRVDCTAFGNEKDFMGGEKQLVTGRQAFVVAVFLKGDQEAQQLANQYASIEKRTRRVAQEWERHQRKRRSDEPLAQLAMWLGESESKLPADWPEQFMLYDARSLQNNIRPHLSQSLQQATDDFLEARHRVLRLTQ